MEKYKTIIEAVQYTGENEHLLPLVEAFAEPTIATKDGPIVLDVGDWVIKDCQGNYWVVANKEFLECYSKV